MPFAFDKSARSYDVDGRLHLTVTNISKAAINGYLGREIPDYQNLGLDPNKIYKMFRDPVELQKAAPTFNNLPLLSRHVAVSAHDHRPDLVVGSTGSDAAFNPPYLRTSLVVWDQASISGIEDETQKELSSSYRYTARMEPGDHLGEKYDGRMTNIIGNHVALVSVGRAGPDVVVGDSNPFEETPMKFNKQQFEAKVKPLLAQDSAITFERFVSLAKIGVDVVRPCLAQDAQIDDKELAAIVESAGKTELAQDALSQATELLGTLSDADRKAIKSKFFAADEFTAAKAKKDDEDEDDEVKKENPKAAMDAAIKTAEDNATKRFTAIRKAEKDVHPLVGEVAAMDSAEAIYKFALDSAGVDYEGVHPSAFGSLVAMAVKAKSPVVASPKFAQDAANSTSQFLADFPGAKIPARTY